SKYSKNATVLRVQIFCSFFLHGHSKQEKLIPAVTNVSILLFFYYIYPSNAGFFLKFNHYNILLAINRQQKAQLDGWALDIFISSTFYNKNLISLLIKTYLGIKTVSIT
ncbi:hypothetical protein, partial [Psychrobacter glacincola]|uniref:hypothetical protein n=1 Tax=Psychrobacter glacincola TaxID=56810 RepID=UPI003BB48908